MIYEYEFCGYRINAIMGDRGCGLFSMIQQLSLNIRRENAVAVMATMRDWCKADIFATPS